MTRRGIPKDVETRLLTASRRRCCLCYYLLGQREPSRGQIAHLNQDASDHRFENLVWLCLNHHDEFDSRTSQSKGITPGEIRLYRDRFYKQTGTSGLRPEEREGQADFRLRSPFQGRWAEIVNAPSDGYPWLERPWRAAWLEERRPDLFAYKSPNFADGICRIERIDLPNDLTVIVCGEIDDNPGMSVTNAVEYVAFQVCSRLDHDVKRLVWLEHYEWDEGDRWNWVTFGVRPPEGMFADPEWHPMTDQDWKKLQLWPREFAPAPSTEYPASQVVCWWELQQ